MDPAALVAQLRGISANHTEIVRRQRALAEARSEVLYDVGGSKLGSRFLEAIVRQCLPLPLLDRALERRAHNWSAAAGKAAGVKAAGVKADAHRDLLACTSSLRGMKDRLAKHKGKVASNTKAVSSHASSESGAVAAGRSTTSGTADDDAAVCRRRGGVTSVRP